jgi:glutamate 5-kinase
MSLKIRRAALAETKRVVVKLGTSLSFDPVKGIDPTHLRRLAAEIATLRRQGKEIVMVISGAIGAGMNRLHLKERPRSIRDKQATAAVGQVYLMDLISNVFSAKGLSLGQVLMTRQDLESGPRYFNARNTIEALLSMGVIPVVNENDTVAVDEIKFGDNDRLAALVTNLVRADLLVILTDVPGLFTADPRKNKRARLVPLVREITPRMEATAGGEGSIAGTGGMVTKLMSARMVTRNGEHCVIGSGRKAGVLTRVLRGQEEGTLFMARPIPKQARLRWMPFSDKRLSEVVVKDPAIQRLKKGKGHLYPADISKVVGHFNVGEVVRLVDRRGTTFAKGVTRYSSRETQKIKGLGGWLVEKILGHRPHDEIMVHDDVAFKGSL